MPTNFISHILQPLLNVLTSDQLSEACGDDSMPSDNSGSSSVKVYGVLTCLAVVASQLIF